MNDSGELILNSIIQWNKYWFDKIYIMNIRSGKLEEILNEYEFGFWSFWFDSVGMKRAMNVMN